MQEIKSNSLYDFLEYKTLYYDKIDFDVISGAWDILSKEISLPFVVHIVGTNGKGSTGRFLAHYLYKVNYKVLHYSSPHILEFNERIWLNGKDIKDEELELAHTFLQNLYSDDILKKLTYFEYTTLLAFYLAKDTDYLILEAGLGGEFDATNVVKNDLSLITTIDFDHQSFLGNSIEEIASTKMRSVDTKMIIGYQIHNEVYDVAEDIKKEKNNKIKIDIIKDFDKYKIEKFALYLNRNIHLAIRCLETLKIDIDLLHFEDVKLFGRNQKILPNVTIDVGHNPLAAKVLAKEFENKKIILIYNSYKDKDYRRVLEILKPIIDKITIIPLLDKRVVKKEILLENIEELGIEYSDDLNIDNKKEYLVFGSFLVVEKFLNMIGMYEK